MSFAEGPWLKLVDRVRQGDSRGLEELYRIVSTGARFWILRQLGPQDVDDRVHDLFVVLVQAIQRGGLRDPERLPGYMRGIVRRQIAGQIGVRVRDRCREADLEIAAAFSDAHSNPERGAMEREAGEGTWRILNALPPRNRELLARFYLEEQPPDRICREMGLTRSQFRSIKCRAKAQFGARGKAWRARWRRPAASVVGACKGVAA
jgi:RNA polymerase sigma-70 factor, ECF subfamily